MNIQIIIPVFYPDCKFKDLLSSLKKQTLKNYSILIIDSGSDGVYKKWLNKEDNVIIRKISQQEFDHGRTRQLGINIFPNKDIYIFLTQDAILADENSLENLVRAFRNEKIGCAYGRQLSHKDASLFADFARKINYSSESYVRSFDDRKEFGIKTAFISNSFAAYRCEAMKKIGGFPSNTILSEDMWVAAKMLISRWQIGYVADACVYHSHNYTIWQEFKRYFDIGVFHAKDKWIRDTFGDAEGAGKDFVFLEMKHIIHTKLFLLVEMLFRDFAKLFGYRLGLLEKYLPVWMKRKISMNTRFWQSM